MSDKKYVLTRRADAEPARTSYLYELTPAPGDLGEDRPVHAEEVEFFRRHPAVEDRTQPDWSDVPVGTPGIATVSGTPLVDGARRGMKSENGFFVVADNSEIRFVADDEVTAFTPDVVVDKALFGAVGDAIINTSLTETDKRIAIAAAHRALRGES